MPKLHRGDLPSETPCAKQRAAAACPVKSERLPNPASAQERDAPRRLGLRSWGLVATYAATLFASAALLRPFLPEPSIPGVTAKLEELHRRGEQVDVLFLGTSRVHHQIIPSLFDRIMEKGGHTTHSFNLGVDGLRTPEDTFLLEKALLGRKRPLRWILLECKDINFRDQDIDLETTRGRYWHDNRRIWILLQRFFYGRLTAGPRFKQQLRSARSEASVLAQHCFLWMENELSVGAAAESMGGFRTPTPFIGPVSARKAVHDGYLGEGNPPVAPEEILTDIRKLNELKRHGISPDYGDRASQHLLREAQNMAARYGAKLVLVIPPTLKPVKFMPDPSLLPIPLLLDLDQPDQYPELFDLQNRRDETHLNERGAKIFTTILAQKLCGLESLTQPRDSRKSPKIFAQR